MKLRPDWVIVTRAVIALASVSLTERMAGAATETQRHYLSGHGPKDAVAWEFFCTEGRRSGTWTTIPVPSQWEQHGFGGYDYGQGSAPRAEERGQYRHRFRVPAEWNGQRVRLVFEGVMTDARVTVNGKSAGPLHAGGFYRFRHDITELIKRDAENLLEVEVAKVSATRDTEIAERHSDYWVFGGIYRPVYLEAVPKQAIDQVAIDARADGSLVAELEFANVTTADRVEGQVLSLDGTPIGEPFVAALPGGGAARARLATRIAQPRLWTAETPQLYQMRTTLRQAGDTLHVVTTRFGFRTFEVRAGSGLYLNGARIVLKGVNRHSFRPETGRALDAADCYDDVRLIQAMNMNAVRMSHYPPDVAFLEACDELGLYVLDELSGWQHAHDTETGRRLVREMVARDVNHPSILFWDNGNEGGWNRAVDVEFSRYDPQQRPVLHPWEAFSGVDAVHYRSYAEMEKRAQGPHLIMPTEYLHGLFDGGGGAGLSDYWRLLSKPPFGAGGFLWVLADEGVVRTDQGGRVDTWSTYGPDGLVGPHHEKEGSYHTCREIFSPVQIDPPVLDAKFDGTITIHNHYSFLPADQCRVVWRTLKLTGANGKVPANQVVAEGRVAPPPIAPGGSGTARLPLPAAWSDADALSAGVMDPQGRELWTWVWPLPKLGLRLAEERKPAPSNTAAKLARDGGMIVLTGGDTTARFDAQSGLLRSLERKGAAQPLANGPRLVWARPSTSRETTAWTKLEGNVAPGLWNAALGKPTEANLIEVKLEPGAAWNGARIEIESGRHWRTIFEGSRRANDGDRYAFPPCAVSGVRITNLERSDGKPAAVGSVRLGTVAARFPTTGDGASALTGTSEAVGPAVWLEAKGGQLRFRWTLRADGSLQLDYRHSAPGPVAYRGVTFDLPDEAVRSFRWLGRGPFRVWKNRIQGTWFGWHELVRQSAPTRWSYPETTGYFAAVRTLRIATATGPMEIGVKDENCFVRIGTPRTDHPNTTVDFPSGDFSLLDGIPAMGSKFRPAAETGPASAPTTGPEVYENTVVFRFDR